MRMLRNILTIIITITMTLIINGCAFQQTVGEHLLSFKQNVKGSYYLRNGKYKEGIASFSKEAMINPSNSETQYYLGRFQLATENYDMALKHLEKAVELSPDEADYHFWLGVAYGVIKKSDRERQCYLNTLELNKNHLQAMTYLGHNHFDKKEFAEALELYQKVLKQWPENPGALFNRALILRHYGRTSEEKLAWEKYLGYYPDGPMARQAVENLNELGEFKYRNYLVGNRTVTLKKISFEAFSSKILRESYPSLDVLGEILKNSQNVSVHIVAYQMKNKKLAEERAKSIKKYLLKNFSEISPLRLKVSWFGVSEKIKAGKKVFNENESINFITAV